MSLHSTFAPCFLDSLRPLLPCLPGSSGVQPRGPAREYVVLYVVIVQRWSESSAAVRLSHLRSYLRCLAVDCVSAAPGAARHGSRALRRATQRSWAPQGRDKSALGVVLLSAPLFCRRGFTGEMELPLPRRCSVASERRLAAAASGRDFAAFGRIISRTRVRRQVSRAPDTPNIIG